FVRSWTKSRLRPPKAQFADTDTDQIAQPPRNCSKPRAAALPPGARAICHACPAPPRTDVGAGKAGPGALWAGTTGSAEPYFVDLCTASPAAEMSSPAPRTMLAQPAAARQPRISKGDTIISISMVNSLKGKTAVQQKYGIICWN